MSERPPLKDLRVLVVEDEGLVAILAEDLLVEAGCEVTLAMRLERAIELVGKERFDVAVLDVNLGGGTTTFPLASMLKDLGVPFTFATGYGSEALHASFPGQEVIRKPYSSNSLCEAVLKAIGDRKI